MEDLIWEDDILQIMIDDERWEEQERLDLEALTNWESENGTV